MTGPETLRCPGRARTRRLTATLGLIGLAVAALTAALAPALAPQQPGDQFPDRSFAPPMRVHVWDDSGLRRPFVYRQLLEDRLERRFREDRRAPVSLQWFRAGHLISIDPENGPLLLMGADALGRDVFSRLLYGARLSLGVTVLGALCALLAGAVIGATAGIAAGRSDALLMTFTDFVLLLPGVYLVLVLRAALPQTMSTMQVFWLMVLLFGVAGWPHVARGVRAVVAAERATGYAEAARAAGAGPIRLARHLIPASYGFLAVELVLLIPAMLGAEATISFLGLGFPEPAPSWGTMLRESGNISGMVSAPWTLAPAVALFFVVLSVNLASAERWEENLFSSQG